jgi:formylglycine-generating enzyme required for sulfatase activity/predicted Ser/Thr protein kinase/dienelactone hydrolase
MGTRGCGVGRMAEQEVSAAELVAATLDLPAEERAAFLERGLRKAPQIRQIVERMLEQRGASAAGDAGQELAPGSRMGRYAIVGRLGAGGMGVVYQAHDGELDRTVAVKVLASRALTNDDARRRFRKESLALAKLSHAHIAGIYDVGRADGADFIVMECVAGESLAAKVKGGPLTVKEATGIVLQIAQALEEAHEHGVIHRDLKPANVMLTPKGQAKVLDFGLAKLFAPLDMDATQTVTEEGVLAGTPRYMSPEQARGKAVNAQTDLWSLGVLYFELLTGRGPFGGEDTFSVLRAILEESPATVGAMRPEVPAECDRIIQRALEKDPAKRYQTASEMVADLTEALAEMTGSTRVEAGVRRRSPVGWMAMTAAVLVAAVGFSWWTYHRWSRRSWASGEALPQIRKLLEEKKPAAAFLLLTEAQAALPADAELKQIADEDAQTMSVTSSPAGATVSIQDYATPDGKWLTLGVTPLQQVRVPVGYFRWRVAKAGVGELVEAPLTGKQMEFPLQAALAAPAGMMLVPAAKHWTTSVDFVGWVGPYDLPSYYVDRYETTNREYQKFVDDGGYGKRELWQEKFVKDGRELSWDEAMAEFRDTSGRQGPSTWVAGHYPEGKADYPVAGVSWYEAAAYLAWAKRRLPVVAQWFQMAPPDAAGYTIRASNISGQALAPVGTFHGVGPFGTYDAAGNVREWVANPVDDNHRYILGGSWKSPVYFYFDPEALSPFDRSDTNGFRGVRDIGQMPVAAEGPMRHMDRDFSKFKPVSDAVFQGYKALYAYPNTPLNAKSEGIVSETADWREEKVSFETGYRGERMAAYLFLPKKVTPPYQTVLFFPSARVEFQETNNGGRNLGDIKFFDYIVQSGRAVMYPIYEDTYERRVKFSLPGGAQNIGLTTDWYKDAARSLDYLATRNDIDTGRMAYLGVSMGSAEGVIAAEQLQDRLKAAVFLDGGFFLQPPPLGGDQADFAPRLKIPVLMVNGRYDFTFGLEKAQNPLFAMLGTPAADKRHLVLDTPHDVTEQKPQLVKAVLDWLDRYLGRVGN